jgi:hypothetical protein
MSYRLISEVELDPLGLLLSTPNCLIVSWRPASGGGLRLFCMPIMFRLVVAVRLSGFGDIADVSKFWGLTGHCQCGC